MILMDFKFQIMGILLDGLSKVKLFRNIICLVAKFKAKLKLLLFINNS